MDSKKQQSNDSKLDRAFYISLGLKAADSALEVVGGLLLLVISPDRINHLAVTLTQQELAENPRDFFARHLLKASHDFTVSGRYFAAFYLLSHGLVKIVLIIALFKQKLWAYPSMIGVLGLFIVYQVYRLSYRFSISLLLLTLFDAFVIWLTWREYQRRR